MDKFGTSVHIDCYLDGEQTANLDMDTIRLMFIEIIKGIGMEIYYFSEKYPAMISDTYAAPGRDETMGCSISVLLTTSSASIHTTKNAIYIDVFTCHEDGIDEDIIIEIIQKYFKIKDKYNLNKILRI